MTDSVIVVGGGLSGLAAATLVARDGRPVTLLERRADLGGRASTLHVDGYALTEGAHALYLGGPGIRVLRALGVDPPGGVPDAAGGKVLHEGQLRPSPLGTLALLRSPVLTLRERVAAGRLLTALRRVRPEDAAGTSAEEWVAAQSPMPGVRTLLRAVVRLATYTDALDTISGDVAALQLRTTLREEVRYVDGGWGAIVDALRDAAEGAGVQIRCGVTVESVGEGPVVRVADGAELAAGAVVLAGLAPAAVERLTGRTVPGAGPALEAACLDVALTGLPCPEHAWTLGLDEPLYVSAYSAFSDIAPPGGAVIHVVRHLAAGESADRGELEDALDRVQPGWRDRLVHANFLPGMTVVSAAATPGAGLAGRPVVDALGLPGVVLAGDWVGPDGWLSDAALASASAAAAAVTAGATRRALAAA